MTVLIKCTCYWYVCNSSEFIILMWVVIQKIKEINNIANRCGQERQATKKGFTYFVAAKMLFLSTERCLSEQANKKTKFS